jgi:hypothetical protein
VSILVLFVLLLQKFPHDSSLKTVPSTWLHTTDISCITKQTCQQSTRPSTRSQHSFYISCIKQRKSGAGSGSSNFQKAISQNAGRLLVRVRVRARARLCVRVRARVQTWWSTCTILVATICNNRII